MGVRGKRGEEIKLSEKSIQKVLSANFLSPNTKKYEMFNLFVYDWESDYLCITKSNYAYEVEIKISRSDFQNDFKNKEKKHLILECVREVSQPNYFYYAVPKGLIDVEEVPDYAGLIYVTEHSCQIVKEAKKLRKEPSDIDELNLVNKFYYAYSNWRWKYLNSEIDDLKAQIKALEKDCYVYDELLSEANCKIDLLEKENGKDKECI